MKRIVLLAVSLLLSACGLKPLYAGGGSGAVAQGLASVDVSAIEGKAGWLVRNALLDRLGSTSGHGSQARYRLDVHLDDRLEGLALLSDVTIGRERRTLRARYQLIDQASGDIVLDATAGSDAGIDVVSSEYATIAAENTALENLSRDIAGKIVTSLALAMRDADAEVKASQRDFAGMAQRAARDALVFYFCGPDEAGCHDAAARIVSLLPDAGERIEFSGAELRSDPVRLGDEARSGSLFGGSRHIVVRAQGDDAHDAVETLLAGPMEAGAAPCPVLIVASGATDKSRTAKLLTNRPDSLVAMFYQPDLRSVAAAVRTMADAAGLRIGGDLAERIARGAGLDTRLAQSEVTKLALYLDASPESPRSADACHYAAIGARTEEDGMMPLVNAVLGGDASKVPDELRRVRELGLNAVALLLAFERRAAQLAGLAARLGTGRDIAALLESEQSARRVFWKDKADLAAQLARWRGQRLERLVDRLTALHQNLMQNSQSAELLLSQGLADIARAARRGA